MTTPMIYLDGRGVPRDEVLRVAQQAAAGFEQIGVREGDTVALLLRNDFAFFEVQQAAAAVGAYGVPINWHGRTDEVTYILEDARPKVLVAHADLLAPIRSLVRPASRCSWCPRRRRSSRATASPMNSPGPPMARRCGAIGPRASNR